MLVVTVLTAHTVTEDRAAALEVLQRQEPVAQEVTAAHLVDLAVVELVESPEEPVAVAHEARLLSGFINMKKLILVFLTLCSLAVADDQHRYALIRDGVVQTIAIGTDPTIWDGQNLIVVLVDGMDVDRNDLYDGTTFTKQP